MRKDKLYATSSVAVATLLAVLLVGMVNWLGARHYVRGDWTSSKIYSLSEKTVNVLEGVDTDVEVVVFMTPSTPLFSETKELLSRYAATSSKISVEYIDPDRDPLRTQTLAEQYGVSAANTVVFVAEERKKYVTSDQLAEYDYSGMQMGQGPKMKGFKGEEQFTSAIMGVVNPTQPKLYFTTGHGEKDLEGFSQSSLSQLKEVLKRDNLEMESVTLLQGNLPGDCDLLIVAGPTAPFTELEKDVIRTYLDGGGRLLVLLDPLLGGMQRASGLEAVVESYGILFNQDLVVDPDNALPFVDLSAVFANEFRSHPVVDQMQGLAVLLPVARSVTTTAAEGASASILLTTTSGGWGERDLASSASGRLEINKDDTDTPGPVSLGVAAQPEEDSESGWRIVAFGDSDFLANGQIANAGNLNLALNTINWLVKREEALGIAPREPEQVQLLLSRTQMRTITLVSLLGLPFLAVVLGVTVWWRRRR